MKRYIMQNLIAWQQQKNRKPLIIKGVRQTGKTYILKQFGKQCFRACHYINFEQNKRALLIFEGDLIPKQIVTEISFLLDKPIDITQDLVIFDELQAAPKAITSLKYFAEELPELALCCAGSLLGLHLGEASFPVGKVDFLHMWPMCFAEFLEANEAYQALQILNECTLNSTIPTIVHEYLWDQLKIFFVTGGLPEVVQNYIDNKDNLYHAMSIVRNKQTDLIYGYYADIAKHSGKINAMHIDRVWRDIPNQLAQSQDGSAKRFQFKGIIPGIDRYQRLANVFDWLSAAELIIKIPIIEQVEFPLTAFTEESRFKLYLFDVGILGALASLPPKTILDYQYGTYKGYFAENFVAQEFITKRDIKLFSWQDNRAEVEFLYAWENTILPVEVKSGWVTKNQSLNKYSEKYQPLYRSIFSAKPLRIDLENKYYQYPLYLSYFFPLSV